jgi:hypothetical protein
MSGDEIKYLSFKEAARLVGAIQEEEDIERQDKRIFTVYSKDDRELCWFDYEEVLRDVGEVEAGERKESVQRHILHHIPDWVKDI